LPNTFRLVDGEATEDDEGARRVTRPEGAKAAMGAKAARRHARESRMQVMDVFMVQVELSEEELCSSSMK